MRTTARYVGVSVTILLEGEHSFATTTPALRSVARAVLGHGRALDLLAFRCEANRIRLVAACDEARARRISRQLKLTLRGQIPPEQTFSSTRVELLRDVWHLQATFKSVLSRSEWVERVDPYQEGSNLLDLLGLRVVGSYTCSTVRAWLPRINRALLLERLGVDDLGAEDLPRAWHTLGESTLAVVAAPDLRERRGRLPAAKRAAVKVASPVLKTEVVARLLCLKPRTVRWLRRDDGERVDPDLVCAITLQLQLRAALAPRAGLAGAAGALLPPTPGKPTGGRPSS